MPAVVSDRKSAVEDRPVLKITPVRIDPKDAAAPAVPAEKERRPYWAGCLPESGYSVVAIAGEDFPAVTEDVVVDTFTQEVRRARRPGTIKRLSDEQVAAIRAAVVQKIIRFTAAEQGRRGRIYSRTDPRFIPFATDEPLASYVYLVPADTLSVADYARHPTDLVMLPKNGHAAG